MRKRVPTLSQFAGIIAVLLLTPFLTSLANAQFIAPIGQDPSAAAVARLRDLITSARDPDLRWPDFLFYRAEVEKFYESDGYSLSWIHRGHARPQAIVLIGMLQGAGDRGLNPEDYDGSRWSVRLASLQGSVSESLLVRFDLALTVCIMRYVGGLHLARLDPGLIRLQVNVGGRKLDLADFLRTQVVAATDPNATLKKIEGKHIRFQSGQTLNRQLLGFRGRN
jgi:L,D-transpeptidase YcbB